MIHYNGSCTLSVIHLLAVHTQVPGLGEPSDWKNVSVDTSLSFGTLRVTTSTMVKEIQQKLENLSSLGESFYLLFLSFIIF